MVPNLSTVRFELDISLLVYQPLNYITVTPDWQQIDTKECTVDDLKDVIYSRLGLQRLSCLGSPTHLYTRGPRALLCQLPTDPPSGDRQMNIPVTPPFPYRPLHTVAPLLHDDAICQLRLPLTAYQTYRELRQFT